MSLEESFREIYSHYFIISVGITVDLNLEPCTRLILYDIIIFEREKKELFLRAVYLLVCIPKKCQTL